MGYLKVVYDRGREPLTSYPKELINYLVRRFHLKKGDKLLELGVGNGDFLSEFSKVGLNCFGIDKEVSPLIKKKLKIRKIDITRGKLPFPNNTFDVVYHKSFLEHFYSNQIDFIMKESYRVLKKGGKLIILVPDWVSQMKTYFEDYTQIHPFNSLALEDLLYIYSFNKVKSEVFYQLPIIWKYPFVKYISRLISLFVSTPLARTITNITKWKFIRWSVELIVLGYGEK